MTGWRAGRSDFQARVAAGDAEAVRQGWQRDDITVATRRAAVDASRRPMAHDEAKPLPETVRTRRRRSLCRRVSVRSKIVLR